MTKIGIIGSEGFLGKTLCKISKNYEYEIIEISKLDYENQKSKTFDILINTATPSKKFWASKNPYLDFQKTVKLTADIAYNWKYEKLIQISSISAGDDNLNHPYAINKKTAELITTYKNQLIVRLRTLYGEGLVKGALYDMLNSKQIYVDANSKFDFISTTFISNWIFKNLEKKGLVELGARDTMSLLEIAENLKLNINASGKIIKISSTRIEPDMPSARDVLGFAKNFNKS